MTIEYTHEPKTLGGKLLHIVQKYSRVEIECNEQILDDYEYLKDTNSLPYPDTEICQNEYKQS